MKTHVVVFGSAPLATWAIAKILAHDGLHLTGVLCEKTSRPFAHHGLEYECVFDYASRKGIEILDIEDLPDCVGPDMRHVGLSVRFPKLIRQDVISLFNGGIINFHGGVLPWYRGVNIANHCILDGASRGGATLHFIDEGVDTGAIVDREFFPIEAQDTGHHVFRKTQQALMAMFERNIDKIAAGEVVSVDQQEYLDNGETTRIYKNADLAAFRLLTREMSPEEISRRVRAFDFPSHEPAYFDFQGRRLYVTSRHEVFDLDGDRESDRCNAGGL